MIRKKCISTVVPRSCAENVRGYSTECLGTRLQNAYDSKDHRRKTQLRYLEQGKKRSCPEETALEGRANRVVDWKESADSKWAWPSSTLVTQGVATQKEEIIRVRIGGEQQVREVHQPKTDQAQDKRRRPMQAWVFCSGDGQLLVIHTPWVTVSVVSSVAPTSSTAQHQRQAKPSWSLVGELALCLVVVDIMIVEHFAGSALRRRQRRLRQWLRHERMTVAMALAEATHHAAPRGLKPASIISENVAPRRQKNAGAGFFELSSDEEVVSAWGMRPAALADPPEEDRPRRAHCGHFGDHVASSVSAGRCISG